MGMMRQPTRSSPISLMPVDRSCSLHGSTITLKDSVNSSVSTRPCSTTGPQTTSIAFSPSLKVVEEFRKLKMDYHVEKSTLHHYESVEKADCEASVIGTCLDAVPHPDIVFSK